MKRGVVQLVRTPACHAGRGFESRRSRQPLIRNDPCCGSRGMFVQSEKFVESHGGRRTDISTYGQESTQTTWRLCKMNLAIRGIEDSII